MALVGNRLFLLPLVGLLIPSPASAVENDEASVLIVLNRELDAGLSSLVACIKAEHVPPPAIHSEWYVRESGRVPADRTDVELRKRQCGRRLLELLDRTSEENLATMDTVARERAANLLLDLGDWIAGEPRYGNLFILQRCQDLATVPLAHLATDLSYPESKLDALANRLRTWAELSRLCADALNAEAPAPVFVAGEGSTFADVQRPLERAWDKGVRQIMAWQEASGRLAIGPPSRTLRAALPAELKFYCDDDLFGESTTRERWDVKFHSGLVLGLGGVNAENLRRFLLFRKKVGRFPTEPPSWCKPGRGSRETPIEAAFEAAWRPFRMELGPIYGRAARVYVEVTTNTFYDEDTRHRRPREGTLPPNVGLRSSPRGPLTRPARRSAWIELAVTRPTTRPTTQPATKPATQ
jgi:hypothetical protein